MYGRRHGPRWLLPLLGLLAPVCLLAQSGDMDEALVELEPIVVSAARFDELVANLPVNLDLITASDIARSGSATIVELLEKEAGVFFRSTTGNASQAEIDLRGFGENSGTRTLVLVDGVKLNRPDIGSLNWLQIPLSEIETIEVIRGTQTALYGNNATGGVIKITTRRGQGIPGANLSVMAGGYGLADVRGGATGSKGPFTFAASGEYNQLDGYRDNSRYEASSASASLGWQATPRLSLRTAFAYTDTQSLLPGGLTLAMAQANPRQSLNSPGDSWTDESIWRLDASATLALEDEDALELNLGWNRRDLSWNLAGPGGDNLIQTFTLSPRHTLERDAWKLVYGLDYIRDSLDFTAYQNNNRARPTGTGSLIRNSLGGYGYLQYEINPAWIASAGLRLEGTFLQADNLDLQPPINSFNESKNDFGTAIDLGLVWKASPHLRLWTRFDRLYRYPATDEIAAYQGYPLSQPFNFGLAPETGYNFELGLDWAREGFFAGANLYAMWIDGEIGFDFIQNLNLNLGDTRRLGTDLNLGYNARHWSLRADYSFIDARYTSGSLDGLTLWLVPRHRLALRGELRPTSRLSLIARVAYTADQLQGNDVSATLPRLPAYTLLDLMARYQISDYASAFIGIDNLTDTRWFSVAYSGVFYPGNGRTWKTGLNLTF